jgi:hypothetical protein
MAATSKIMSQKDQEQAIRQAQNDVNGTIGVDGFLTGLVGRRVTLVVSTTTVTGDTTTFNFSENFGATPLYSIQLVYTDGTQTTLLTATRIS